MSEYPSDSKASTSSTMDQPHQGQEESDTQEQMDAVLDAALDDLDDSDDDESRRDGTAAAKEGVGDSPSAAARTEEPWRPKATHAELPPLSGEHPDLGALDDMMKQLLSSAGGGDADGEAALGAFMQQLHSQLVSEMQESESDEQSTVVNTAISPPTRTTKPETPSSTTPASDTDEVDRTISKLMEDMTMPQTDSTASDTEHAMLNDIMKEFENMGGFNPDDVVDGMMQQLLSKDLMYEPMKQVTEKFPAWLEEHKGTMTEEEFRQRTQQYESFQKLIQVYEQEPGDTDKLMELMQEVQEFGQPPPEIIQDIAPGLQLDSEGLPRLDGNGENPFGSEDCEIM